MLLQMRKLSRLFLGCLFTVSAVSVSAAPVVEDTVRYKISFDNAVHHEARVTATFTALGNVPLEAMMSRSSPGRYALHEFAKHVYGLEAYDSKGNRLAVERPNPHQWTVGGHDGTVKIVYTLFGNRADGTYAGIDASHAHLNIPAVFMWAKGLEQRPVSVKFNVPAGSGWKVATQLKQERGQNVFSAPHLQYFMDSPTELSNYTMRSEKIIDQGKEKVINLVMHHNGTEQEVDAYMKRTMQIVKEQQQIYGELPDFDYGEYTFLACYLPHVAGDGMEHRNSTILTSKRPLSTGADDNLGTVSHEFFHSWNVERIRPASLEPFDFTNANMSGELWLAEGFTSYYGDLAMVRSGNIPLKEYVAGLGSDLNYVLNSPGRNFFSAVEMSMQAPFVDAAVSIEPVNRINTYISYYSYGSVIGLALDLMMRSEIKNKATLDNLMRDLWVAYGKTAIPYSNEDVRATLIKTSGNEAFANNFFNSYIYGKEAAPYAGLLARAGILLRKAAPGQASLGNTRLSFTEGGVLLNSPALINSPLYKAGLAQGDLITAIDGKKIGSEADLKALLQQHKPGDTLDVEYNQLGRKKSTKLILAEEERLEAVLYEEAGMKLSKAMKDFRNKWLASKVLVK
jgi:predicted metalloprotease with PDZ domain